MSGQYITISWESRDIRLFYHPSQWGGVIDHLEIQSVDEEPLPITETGYRSHFFGPVEPSLSIEQVSEMVIEWLNREAQSPAWKTYVEESRQLSLF